MLRVRPCPSTCAPTLTLLVAAILAVLSGCSSGTVEFDDCGDGVDNDGDGLIDGLDPGCELNDYMYETPDPQVFVCDDGIDNDSDGLTDFPTDPGCTDRQDSTEENEPTAQCFDGLDNDEDGLIDYPRDPGCFSRFANSEIDDCPSGPQCPACSNRIDDDDDGVFDYPADPGCDTAVDDNEFNANVNNCGPDVAIIDLAPNATVSGAAVVDGHHYLASPVCGGLGQETVYRMTFTQPSFIVATTELPGTNMDTVLYIRKACRDISSEIACNDDGQTLGSTIATAVDADTYFIVVDAHHPTTAGDFAMRVDVYAGPGTMCDPMDPNACPPGYECRPLDDSTVEPTCELPECMDGIDNDFDGYVDYPNDPGCTAETASDETDVCQPNGVGCPQCFNLADDDSDGLIDFGEDLGCSSAADDSEVDCEQESDLVEILTEGTTLGSTVGFTNDFSPSCDFAGFPSPDRAYVFNVPTPLLALNIDTIGSSFDTVLTVKSPDCSGPDLACDDNGAIGGSGESSVQIPNPAAGSWIIIVDGIFGSMGAVQLNVNGVIPGGQACDATTIASGLFSCELGYECVAGTCAQTVCNDGLDDDGDGYVGYPDDPGCTDIGDTDESDDCPNGPSCPQCSNMFDDDGDGFIDYGADIGCLAASDNNEQDCNEETDPVLSITSSPFTGNLVGGNDDFIPSCFFNNFAEFTHHIQVPDTLDTLVIDTIGSSFEAVLTVKAPTCGDPDLDCQLFNTPSGAAQITLTSVAPGPYFAIVESAFGGMGAYTLNVRGELPTGASCDPASTMFVCGPSSSCSGGVCAPSLCTNGADDDGDGLIDFGADPGCASESDNDEFDDCPTGPMCPACANGADDDGDGLVDYPADTGCAAIYDDNEANCEDSEGLFPVEMMSTFTGDTFTATNDHEPTCGAPGSPEHVYWLQVPVPLASVRASTVGSGFDTVLYAHGPSCSGLELQCDDDGGGGLQSLINLGPQPPGDLFIVVDGYGGDLGSYILDVTGVIQAGEACDSDLVTDGVLSCPTGTTCMDDGTGALKCL